MSLDLNAYVVHQLDNANFVDVRRALQNAGGGPITNHITGDDFVSYAITKVIPSHLTEASPEVLLLLDQLIKLLEDSISLNQLRAMATTSDAPTSSLYWVACEVAFIRMVQYTN